MAIFVAVFAVSPETSYAAYNTESTYPLAYGEKSTDEEFYVWHRVKSDKVPMYKYLTDGATNEKEYLDHKQFRVMIINHATGTFSEDNIAGVEGTRSWWEWGMGQWHYDTYFQYLADWTRIKYDTINNYAVDSIVACNRNSQVKPLSESFITRGAQRSFVCSYAKQWVQGVDHTDNLANQYSGLYKYNFYYPDKDDKKSIYTLSYCYDRRFGGCHNFYVYDDNGWPCGMGVKSGSEMEHRLNVGLESKSIFTNNGDFADTWALWSAGNDKTGNAEMRILAFDEGGTDYTLTFSAGAELMLNYAQEHDRWVVFVGEPCSEELISNLCGTGTGGNVLGSGYRTISTPAILRKEEDFTIETEAALFVDTLLIVRGNLINKGILVVAPGAAIICWDGAGGKIVNDGGDIIVKKNGKVFVNEFEAQNQSLQLFDNLYAKKASVNSGVIASRNNANVKGASNVNNYDFINVSKNAAQNEGIVMDTSKFGVNGSGTSVYISKDVLK